MYHLARYGNQKAHVQRSVRIMGIGVYCTPMTRVRIQRSSSVAERNPRLKRSWLFSPQSGRQIARPMTVARSTGCDTTVTATWGCARKASLHPRLYACACFAGLPHKNIDARQAKTFVRKTRSCRFVRDRDYFCFLILNDVQRNHSHSRPRYEDIR